ncbi:hypothetical protein [Actinoplanes derwentensis]|uniref:PT repeat-containing protein n=1 Tax=Actinoplanes derwentensis TaxID=113562 RepID=A0A1H1QTJ1_9ACTN|nr:hypothetical protein [Actinoplanes derwentensis]GID89334.1 hypothetical protein Ade03nite_82580 [Actinoplanes derwentensis]SDS26791.1 hypothetical protein SAMN04489716_0396 [Actinoplanes derwentensis]
MPVVSSKAHRSVAAVFAVSVALLFTAACSGTDETSTDSNGTTGQNGGGNTAFAAYISCLNENGVTITMPSGGPGGGMGNGGTRPSGAPDGGGARPSGAPDGNGARPSGQPRPSGSAGQRGGGGFPGGGGFSKPDGVDEATWTKAQEACASVRPSMGAGGGQRGGGNGNQGGGGANAAYENCLKENGVTDTANLDTTDATVKKATETCSVLKPTATATS